MPLPQSEALLFRLLQGDTPSAAEVAGLVRAFAAQQELEGQWFDAKSGALLQNRQGDELRAAVCGFANAEGGFLLIGYSENAKAFDHVASVGKQPPEQWVTDALGSITHMIPPPRFATVDVEGGPVLLVAIERARSLVYVIEDGQPVYYLRFGHQTKPMPQTLVTDLVLGRRAQPELRVLRPRVGLQHVELGTPRVSGLDIALSVILENDAMTVAQHARAGLVCWTIVDEQPIPEQLFRSVDLKPPPSDLVAGDFPWGRWNVFHAASVRRGSALQGAGFDLEPFDQGGEDLRPWRIPIFTRHAPQSSDEAVRAQAWGAVEIRAALYLLARNAEPR